MKTGDSASRQLDLGPENGEIGLVRIRESAHSLSPRVKITSQRERSPDTLPATAHVQNFRCNPPPARTNWYGITADPKRIQPVLDSPNVRHSSLRVRQ
jgi:hypothetical protein